MYSPLTVKQNLHFGGIFLGKRTASRSVPHHRTNTSMSDHAQHLKKEPVNVFRLRVHFFGPDASKQIVFVVPRELSKNNPPHFIGQGETRSRLSTFGLLDIKQRFFLNLSWPCESCHSRT